MADQPLLPGDGLQEAEEEKSSSWREDFNMIMAIAGPAILQLSFQQAVVVANQSFAGHLGPDELAGAALAITIFNLMWFFILGAASALDTLASQAFGAGDRPGVLSWAISAAVVLSLLAVPMGVGLFYGDPIAATLFRQPPEISQLVGVYCRGILPGLLPFIWSLVIMKAMQAQNHMWGPTLATMLMFGVNFPINVVCIRVAGFQGAAYAQSATRIALFLMLSGYVATLGSSCIQLDRTAWHLRQSQDGAEAAEEGERFSTSRRIREAVDAERGGTGETETLLQGPSPELLCSSPFAGKPALSDGGESEVPFAHPSLRQVALDGLSRERLLGFLKLASAGGFMMAADASSFDITTAMAGFLGTEEVDAHICMLSVIEFVCTAFPFGIATAATIRVGNMLGAGKAASARQSAYPSLGVCACFNTAVMLLFFGFGGRVGEIFTTDATVVRLTGRLALLAGLYQLPDCLFNTVSGILRGTGRQTSLMLSNLLGFWGVGMPICYFAAFRWGLGVRGLWIGLVAGLSAAALLVCIMLALLDWEAEAAAARTAVAALQAAEAAEAEEVEAIEESGDSLSTLPRDGPGQSRPERRRSARSDTIPIQRSGSAQLLGAGSLTGSYSRIKHSHL